MFLGLILGGSALYDVSPVLGVMLEWSIQFSFFFDTNPFEDMRLFDYYESS